MGLVAFVAAACALGALWWTQDMWKPYIVVNAKDDEKKPDAHEQVERIKLSEQAQKNLRLVVKEPAHKTYWRKISLPGTVVDRPGRTDRGIPAPIAGVVVQVYAIPGKTIKSGDDLFKLRLVSESFQTSQMELYKSVRELEITQKERKRLESISSAVPPVRLLELEYQHDRLKVLIDAYRQDLRTRQLAPEQIDGIEKGKFVTEVVVRMPNRLGDATVVKDDRTLGFFSRVPRIVYEMHELKVNLGDYVQAGQVLAYVADHRMLYIEGRALKQEARWLTQAAKEGWPVEADFADEDPDAPADRLADLHIEFLGNTMDASGLTLPVYVPFFNPVDEYSRDGKMHRKYRPGQKVVLRVPVSMIPDVLEVPIAAVAREGPEAYVFKQDGNSFLRKAVHVVAQDSEVVAIANDGTILPHHRIAYNGAAALNRALKAAQAEGGGHHHDH
jgi:multidrug efflux pump subunit AcrA (membrane-fusion protein)